MARAAAKASAAPQGKPVTAPKAKDSTPSKNAKAKAAAPPPAPAKTAKVAEPLLAPAKAAKSKASPLPPTPAKAAKAKTPAPPPPPPSKPAAVTLKHLAANLSESHGLSRRDAESFAVELIADLVDQIKGGARVRIAGLGILEIKDRPARMGRNPATGASVQIAASRKVAFRIAKDLKEAI